jgi:hypothetical protein
VGASGGEIKEVDGECMCREIPCGSGGDGKNVRGVSQSHQVLNHFGFNSNDSPYGKEMMHSEQSALECLAVLDR